MAPAPSVPGVLENNGDTISYDFSPGSVNPAVMYLPALDCPKSDLKATIIKRYCQSTERSYLSADWFGVGESSGDFTKGTVSRWTADTIKVSFIASLYCTVSATHQQLTGTRAM
jgi:hypothetical protein